VEQWKKQNDHLLSQIMHLSLEHYRQHFDKVHHHSNNKKGLLDETLRSREPLGPDEISELDGLKYHLCNAYHRFCLSLHQLDL
jgi:hypothetical protein